MKFKTQVCTTREQSERLLALGLKKETSDFYYDHAVSLSRPIIGTCPTSAMFSLFIPAWSLHRLMEIANFRGTAFLDIPEAYETLIEDIKSKIRFKLIDESLIDSK